MLPSSTRLFQGRILQQLVDQIHRHLCLENEQRNKITSWSSMEVSFWWLSSNDRWDLKLEWICIEIVALIHNISTVTIVAMMSSVLAVWNCFKCCSVAGYRQSWRRMNTCCAYSVFLLYFLHASVLVDCRCTSARQNVSRWVVEEFFMSTLVMIMVVYV